MSIMLKEKVHKDRTKILKKKVYMLTEFAEHSEKTKKRNFSFFIVKNINRKSFSFRVKSYISHQRQIIHTPESKNCQENL